MSISIRKDISPFYKLGDQFNIRQTPGFESGSYLDLVRTDIANHNFRSFRKDWKGGYPKKKTITRRVLTELGKKYSLKTDQDVDIYTVLSDIIFEAKTYRDHQKDQIDGILQSAYVEAAHLVADQTPADPASVNWPTWQRRTETDAENLVIFSDLHMMAFDEFSLENYFLDRNYQLYLDVLRVYADTDFTLVENGDVEECVICLLYTSPSPRD